ncbi:MAG TPA: hypothetical protein VN808_00435, partial [Stellaceae bacterium]|nr:hypothetical protein [Stellaceae bacterium]
AVHRQRNRREPRLQREHRFLSVMSRWNSGRPAKVTAANAIIATASMMTSVCGPQIGSLIAHEGGLKRLSTT